MPKNVTLEEGKYRYGIFKDTRYPKPNLPDIRYEFFQVAITAFVQDLRRLLKLFMPNVPVYIFNTGEQLLTDDWQQATTQEIPRCVIDIDGLSIASDQLTNPYQRGQFVINQNKQDVGFSAYLRRIPLTLDLPVKITVSNIIEQLRWQEILLLILYRNNMFHFQYYKKDNRGVYRLPDSFDTERNIEFGFDDQRRNRTISINIQVDLQYPAFDIFDTSSLMSSGNVIKGFNNSIYPDPSSGESGEKNPTPGNNSVNTTYSEDGTISSEVTGSDDPNDPNEPNNPNGSNSSNDPYNPLNPDGTPNTDEPLGFTGPDYEEPTGGGNNNYSISEADDPFGDPSYPVTGDSLVDDNGNPIDYDEDLIRDEIIGMRDLGHHGEVKNPNATNSWEPLPGLSVHEKEDVLGSKQSTKPRTGDPVK